MEQINYAYKMPFSEYIKLDRDGLTDLYKDYIVLGVYEWIKDGVLILIDKKEVL